APSPASTSWAISPPSPTTRSTARRRRGMRAATAPRRSTMRPAAAWPPSMRLASGGAPPTTRWGRPSPPPTPLGHINTTTYDAVGGATRQTTPVNAQFNYNYDAAGRRISVVDPRGGIVTTAYDAAGRATSEEWMQFRPDVAALTRFAATYSYDAANRPIQVV